MSRCPPPPLRATPGDPHGVKSQNLQFTGGTQCAKTSPYRDPKRSYTVSNNTLEGSGGCAQPPVTWVLHLDPSVAGLEADLKGPKGMPKRRPGRFRRPQGVSWRRCTDVTMCPIHPHPHPRATPGDRRGRK